MSPAAIAIIDVLVAAIPELVRQIRGAADDAAAEAHARRLIIDAAYEIARRADAARYHQ